MGRIENVGKKGFISGEPCDRGQASSGSVDAIFELFFEDDGEQTSEKTLDKVEDVVDGRRNFPDGLENIRMENHLPLDTAFGSEKGSDVNGELESELGTSGEVYG